MERKRRWGDRKDGYLDRTATGMANIMFDLKPNRCDSEVYMNTKLDMTEFVKFMKEQKKEHEGLTYFHGLLYAMGKMFYKYPLMNRFVANRKMYIHKEVGLAFVAKAEFSDGAEEFMTVQKIKPEDTLLTVYEQIKEKVSHIRANKHDGGANNIVDSIGHFPRYLRSAIVGILKWVDRVWGLPGSIAEDNIYYSSAILSNLGTFKVGAIHHNLANLGTSSSLITFGEIKQEDDGKYYMEFGATLDERIADGFYFCKVLKGIEYVFKHPELLLKPAKEDFEIPKEENKKNNTKK